MNTVGFVVHLIGELFIAYSILGVHSRVSIERKIDIHIARAIARERITVFIGIGLIITGSLMERLL